MKLTEYPIPPHYSPEKVQEIWRVPYEKRANEAYLWAKCYHIKPAYQDLYKINLFIVDVQNTFCIPGGELFVAGQSGIAAVEDNQRLCAFLYKNLGNISQITLTMDTHQTVQIFHSIFLIDENGNHPKTNTLITTQDVTSGHWKFNPNVSASLKLSEKEGQEYLTYYVNKLAEKGKYDLTIWPYHAMLGGIGHALVSSLEEAIFFHSIARSSQPDFELKGFLPLTENYSVIKPEVERDPSGKVLGKTNQKLIDNVREFDMTIIAGQAKSHCVAFTVSDLLEEIKTVDLKLVNKIYLLEDCTSPVVIPDVIDYSEMANIFFSNFRKAGIHIIKSTDEIDFMN
jgi:nicotinamidase-related amidase